MEKKESNIEMCFFCNKRVYAAEAITVNNTMVHPSCFRCQKEGCGTKLSLLNFVGVGGQFFCAKHASQAGLSSLFEARKRRQEKVEKLKEIPLVKNISVGILRGRDDTIVQRSPVGRAQFFQLCEKYSKTYLSLDDARLFLKELSQFAGVNYDEQEAIALIEQCDENHDGWITLKEFEHLFFASSQVLQIDLTMSLRDLQIETLQRYQDIGAGRSPAQTLDPTSFKGYHPPPPPPLPPPGGGPTPGAPIKKKWAVVEEEDHSEWHFNGKIAQFMPISEGLDWTSCKGFSKSSAGSIGVFFLGWEGDKVVVLKGSSTVLADKIATEIGLWSKLPMPNMHIIKFGIGNEFLDVIKCLDRLDKLKPENLRGTQRQMIQIPILTVMEFVPGTDFSDVDPIEAFTTANCDKAELHKRLFDIGRVIIYDVLLNNWDRLPIIWNSNGNLGNMFYSKNPKQRIVAIDNALTSIPLDTDPFRVYLGTVRELFEQIVTWDGTEGSKPLVDKMRKFFKSEWEVDIGIDGTRSIWQGFIHGALNILDNVTKNKLENLKAEMEIEVEQVFEAMVHGQDFSGKYGLARVDLDFINSTFSVFEEFKSRLKVLAE